VSIFTKLFPRNQPVLPPAIQAKSSGSYSVLANMDGSSFLGFALRGGNLTATEAFRFYRDCGAVATAVDMIADEVEQIVPIIKGPDGHLTRVIRSANIRAQSFASFDMLFGAHRVFKNCD